MIKRELGRLERVNLRDVWGDESSDFTPWLAEPENLKLLGDTIGMELDLVATEKPVGRFWADLVCKDIGSDSQVVIENQIAKTDHSHLGQLLTYAAGLDAATVVWVAEEFASEHRAALDWLNEHTREGINFFGLETELWRIGDSLPAPKFNMVSQPNEWRRMGSLPPGRTTTDKLIQLRFWTAFKECMDQCSKLPCSKPSPRHWMHHPTGISGVRLSSVASMWNSESNSYSMPEIRVELVLDGTDSKHQFAALEQQKQLIQESIHTPLTWHNPPDTRMSRIYTRKDADVRNENVWPEQHTWLKDTLELFHRVFMPVIDTMSDDAASEG